MQFTLANQSLISFTCACLTLRQYTKPLLFDQKGTLLYRDVNGTSNCNNLELCMYMYVFKFTRFNRFQKRITKVNNTHVNSFILPSTTPICVRYSGQCSSYYIELILFVCSGHSINFHFQFLVYKISVLAFSINITMGQHWPALTSSTKQL